MAIDFYHVAEYEQLREITLADLCAYFEAKGEDISPEYRDELQRVLNKSESSDKVYLCVSSGAQFDLGYGSIEIKFVRNGLVYDGILLAMS